MMLAGLSGLGNCAFIYMSCFVHGVTERAWNGDASFRYRFYSTGLLWEKLSRWGCIVEVGIISG